MILVLQSHKFNYANILSAEPVASMCYYTIAGKITRKNVIENIKLNIIKN